MISDENKAIRLKWAEALESGNYLQGRNRLKSGRHYCCLGVACKLNLAKQRGTHLGDPDGSPLQYTEPFGGYTISDVGAFVRLNDHYKLSFPQIAKIIRLSIDRPEKSIVDLYRETKTY